MCRINNKNTVYPISTSSITAGANGAYYTVALWSKSKYNELQC